MPGKYGDRMHQPLSQQMTNYWKEAMNWVSVWYYSGWMLGVV